jgi:hypothetical protein
MIINPAKSKAVCFPHARVTESLYYQLRDIANCTYLGIILRSYLSWADKINYTAKKAWKAPHIKTCVLKNGNCNAKRLACTSVVRQILEYASSCWYTYREGEINALEQVQYKSG